MGGRHLGLVPFLLVTVSGIVQETNAIIDAVVAAVVGATIALC